MHHNLHTTARPRALFRAAAPELSYQDYLRISQSARAARDIAGLLGWRSPFNAASRR
jgi:hypothetical protein